MKTSALQESLARYRQERANKPPVVWCLDLGDGIAFESRCQHCDQAARELCPTCSGRAQAEMLAMPWARFEWRAC